MTRITEHPILNAIRLEVFNITRPAPLILDYSRLDVGTLGAGGETPDDQWTDWTPQLVQLTTERGGSANGVAIDNNTGVLTALLRNVHLDTLAPQFLSGQRIRLQHVSPLGVRSNMYTGRVLDVNATRTLDGTGRIIPVTEIKAVDAYADHDQITRYGAMPPTGSETFAQRIARLTGSAVAPIEQPTFPTIPTLGRTVYESSLTNHLDMACNTVGAMWWIGSDGITRFAPRNFDMPHAVTFIGQQIHEENPPEGLHYLTDTSASGSQAFFNRIRQHNHGAQLNEDNEWRADDTDITVPANIGGSIYGFHDADLDTNYAPTTPTYDGPTNWVIPTSQFIYRADTITWNAQEDLTRIPNLEIGTSIYLPWENTGIDPWPWNILIGIKHTITPTRWITQLTLIGVANP